MKKVPGCLLLLLALPLLCMGSVFAVAEYQLRRVYHIPDANLTIPTDEASMARGQHFVEVIGGCPECHRIALDGDRFFVDDPLIGSIPAANLTPHETGIGSVYSPNDWERAIRHGVGRDGRALIGVSSGVLQHLSDDDVAAMIAYLQTIPPKEKTIPTREVGPLARPFLFLANILPEEENDIMPALAINHNAPRPPALQPGVTAEYGGYLVSLMCVECHKLDLGGGSDPGEGMNITTGGNLGNWTEEEFLNTIKLGWTPDGRFLLDAMPQERFHFLTNDELKAIWLYIQSLPPVVRS
jgi:mono/diheme cytochrome c family protein